MVVGGHLMAGAVLGDLGVARGRREKGEWEGRAGGAQTQV